MLRRIGYFDFIRESDDPVKQLHNELQRLARWDIESLSGSLVVLPEAFNLVQAYYRSNGVPNEHRRVHIPAPSAIRTLSCLSAEYQIMFVAGLLDCGFSIAYWISPSAEPQLMCYKLGEDGSGNYVGGDPNVGSNPIEQHGACVGALICLDALHCREETLVARRRRERLITAIKESRQRHKVMCIPAHMSSHCMPRIEGLWSVLASSGGRSSAVMDPQGNEVAPASQRGRIRLVALPN